MFEALRQRVQETEVTWHWYVLALASGAFALVRLLFSFPRFSDGNVYLYIARAVAGGGRLYAEVFYSSPPLLPYLYAAWGSVFGFTWQSFNFVPLAATLVDAGLLYFIARRCGRLAAVTASLAYLSSFVVLATTDFVSDVHVVTTLVLAGTVAAGRGRFGWAGVWLGLAMLAKVYAGMVVAAWLGIVLSQRRWRSMVRLLGGVGGVGVAALVFWLRHGRVFYEALVTSHLGEIAGLSRVTIWRFFAAHDVLLLAGAGLAAVAAWRLRRLPPAPWVVMPLVYALFLLLYQDVYYLYFKILAASLAVLLGWAVAQWAPIMSRVWRVAGVGLFVLAASWGAVRYGREQVRTAVIDDFDGLTAAVEELVEPGQVLYGAFDVAPLVASAAGRELWRHLADTNIKFFQTGYVDQEVRAAQIAADRVPVVVTRGLVTGDGSFSTAGKRIIGGPSEVLPLSFFERYCRVGRVFPVARDYVYNAVVVWRCVYE